MGGVGDTYNKYKYGLKRKHLPSTTTVNLADNKDAINIRVLHGNINVTSTKYQGPSSVCLCPLCTTSKRGSFLFTMIYFLDCRYPLP